MRCRSAKRLSSLSQTDPIPRICRIVKTEWLDPFIITWHLSRCCGMWINEVATWPGFSHFLTDSRQSLISICSVKIKTYKIHYDWTSSWPLFQLVRNDIIMKLNQHNLWSYTMYFVRLSVHPSYLKIPWTMIMKFCMRNLLLNVEDFYGIFFAK